MSYNRPPCSPQDDEDLVLEFVCNQGLNALVSVGRDSDQTYQQYILKAVGELSVYVDGMNGLIQCNEIIQWLYQLTASKVSHMTQSHDPCRVMCSVMSVQ